MSAGTQKGLLKFLIDKSASRFTVQVFSTGFLSAFGHNPTLAIRDYDGEIQVAPETYEDAQVRVIVRTKRMDVMDQMKSDDRNKLEKEMYTNVLGADRFPTVTYESTEVSVQKLGSDLLMAHVVGDLSFHGVKRVLPIDARVTRTGTMLRISGQYALRQSEYGIKPISFAAGTLKLKDELKFSFELVAREQENQEQSDQT